ncbi:MAG: carbamoyltransferase HypF, partial [Planctomycetota bacterium]
VFMIMDDNRRLPELFDKKSRRYKYPFINCVNCVPEYSLPRGRSAGKITTALRNFKMCKDCSEEYEALSGRRSRLLTNCCPHCGPSFSLLDNTGHIISCDDPVEEAVKLIKNSSIIAVRGFSGFHILCDAANDSTVEELRLRRNQPLEPLSVMVCDIDTVNNIAQINELEREILGSPRRPIVMLTKKENNILSNMVAPDVCEIGVMLPCTAIQHLIMKDSFPVLIAASACTRDNPTVPTIYEALKELPLVVDYLLIHNINIVNQSDDSIITAIGNKPLVLRRGRGYATQPIKLPCSISNGSNIVGVGSDKNATLCVAKGGFATLTRCLGDLKSVHSYSTYKKEAAHIGRVFNYPDTIIAHDAYSGYTSTRYAISRRVPRILVEHDFAHVASCLVENKTEDTVIGVVYDGGFTRDGGFRGAQFSIASLSEYKRVGHLQHVELPGGERALKEPWRTGLAYLYHSFGYQMSELQFDFMEKVGREKVALVSDMLERKINCPVVSSMRCLFDSVAAMLGICIINTYDEEASLELASLISTQEDVKDKAYPYEIKLRENQMVIDPTRLIYELAEDVLADKPLSMISAVFHNTIASTTADMCHLIRQKYNVGKVALSGDMFENKYLTIRILHSLGKEGFTVYQHALVPPNDTAVSLGQVAVARAQIQKETSEKVQ